ncbi:NAD(P)-binding protein [Periconia macrospinosa]|uniref:NAD(P)-binding protein n=1 Tax=Periconia macrospinosa TaxID=97972 RepID=A0A2V1E5G4_9PLEO|nr:NAD(P)-binding protein [Periconia macrospinosa]
MSIKNVTLIGASGNLGPAILSNLIDASFNVTILSREGSSSTFPPNIKVVRADFSSHDSLVSAFQGQDAIVASLASSALDIQPKIIDAAIAAGVKRFIPSEFGSNTLSPELNEVIPIFGPKVNTVNYLKSKEDSISWTAYITGAFFDWGLKVGFVGVDGKTKTANLIDGGNGKSSVTTLNTIGLAVAKGLQNPELTKNQYVTIASFTTTQNEILAAAEKVSGTKFTIASDVSSAELTKTGQEKLGKGDHSGVVDLLRAGNSGSRNLGDNTVLGLWNDKLGLPKEDFEEVIKSALGL